MAENLFGLYVQTPIELPLRGKSDIIETLYEVGLPADSCLVLGGANMVLRGIKRFTTDLDLMVSAESFRQLTDRPDAEIKQPPIPAQFRGAINESVWVSGPSTPIPISATESLGDGMYPMSFEEYRGRAELVDFVPCLPLGNVIASKAAIQRPKDISDLDEIFAFTGQSIDLPPPPAKLPI